MSFPWTDAVMEQADAAAAEAKRLFHSGQEDESARWWDAYSWLLWIAYPPPCNICGDPEDHGGRSHSLATRARTRSLPVIRARLAEAATAYANGGGSALAVADAQKIVEQLQAAEAILESGQ